MWCNFGFKCDQHYYQIIDTKNYPVVSLSKITYENNIPVHHLVLSINIYENDISDAISYLESELKDSIDVKKKAKNEILERGLECQSELDILK